MNVSDTLVADVAYFTAIDYALFIIILSFSIGIGVYFAFFTQKLKTTEDYLVGGHKMKPLPIAISLVASQLSAISIVAIPAEIYAFGWQYVLVIPTVGFIILIVNYLFLPVFYQNNIDNCYAYLEMRFGSSIRNIMTITFILSCFCYMPVVMFIPSLSFATVTQLNLHMVNTVMCYICVIYTMLGGIQAVVWTDVLQGSVMIGSVVIIAVLGVHKVGGPAEVLHRAIDGNRIFPPDFTLDLVTRTTIWNTVMCVLMLWTVHIGFSQSCVQRLVALPSLKLARRSMVYFFFGVALIMAFMCGTGITIYAFYHDCDPVKAKIITKYDKLMPRFVQDVTGHVTGMSGIFISCVFSASLSTVSAVSHSISGIVYNDYIRPRRWFAHTDFNANLTMRIIIILLGTICALSGVVVEHFESIFQITMTIAGTFLGATFGVFTLGMLYPWANKKGVLVGTIVSVTAMLAISFNSMYHTSEFHYEPLPMSTEGCSQDILDRLQNMTLAAAPKAVANGTLDDGFAFYKISFQWFTSLGVLATWIPAIIVSHLTGGTDLTTFNFKLLSPCVEALMPKKYRHTEMKLIRNVVVQSKHQDNQNGTKGDSEAAAWIFRNDDNNESKT